MRNRTVAAILVGAVVGVGAGYIVIQNAGKDMFDQAVKEHIPAGVALSYDGARFGLLSHSVRLRHVVLSTPEGSLLTVDKLALFDPDGHGGYARLAASGIHVVSRQSTLDAGAATVQGLELSASIQRADVVSLLASSTFQQAEMQHVSLDAQGIHAHLSSARIDGYGPHRPSSFQVSSADGYEGPQDESLGAGFSVMSVQGVGLADAFHAMADHTWAVAQTDEQTFSLKDGWISSGGAHVVEVGSLSQHVAEPRPGFYTHSFEADGLRAVGKNLIAAELRDLGYGEVLVNVSGHSMLESGRGLLDVPRLRMSAPGVGTLDLSLQMDALPLGMATGLARMSPQASAMAMAQTRLVSASLAYADSGLVGHAVDTAARNRSMSAQAFRQGMETALRTGPSITALSAEADVRTAMADFIESPDRIVLSLAPPHPVAMRSVFQTYVSDPDSAVGQLGFSVHVH